MCLCWSKEYIQETKTVKTKLKDRVWLCRQHLKQPEHQQLKIKEHKESKEDVL